MGKTKHKDIDFRTTQVSKVICITESFNTNSCESTALEHKFKRWFSTKKPVLNVSFKDFWYTKKIQHRFGMANTVNKH